MSFEAEKRPEFCLKEYTTLAFLCLFVQPIRPFGERAKIGGAPKESPQATLQGKFEGENFCPRAGSEAPPPSGTASPKTSRVAKSIFNTSYLFFRTHLWGNGPPNFS
jgi:hypothetical protein